MENTKKPFYKKWWFWVLVFLFLLVMGNLNTKKSAPEVQDPEPEPVQEEVQEVEAPKTTVEELEAIVDSVVKKKSHLNVVETKSGRYNINMHYEESSWDETYFVSSALTAYIKICKEAYQMDGVDVIEFYLIIPMIDAKGNQSDDIGFSMVMPKDKFESFNWSNLAYKEGIYDTVADNCDQITINPGVANKADLSKVMYKE